MFDSLKKIFSKKPAPVQRESITLDQLKGWLDDQEQDCINRRMVVSARAREHLMGLKQDLQTLLTEFGEETGDEPRHHKVEQVNRHNLPQFCKKIEIELKRDFSDDDETFYREIAGLINGCFKAYRGPGRYLHILYPDEVKAFRQTLDQMGQELNQMTDVMRISIEHLSRIEAVRDAVHEHDEIIAGYETIDDEIASVQKRRDEQETSLIHLIQEMETLKSSAEYREYVDILQEMEKLQKGLSETCEAADSLIRNSVPVWRRAARVFSEKGRLEDERKIEDLIQTAASPRRNDAELLNYAGDMADLLFGLFDSGSLQTKNSFEKSLFSSAEAYRGKIFSIKSSLISQAEKVQNDHEKTDNSVVFREEKRLIESIQNREHEHAAVIEEEMTLIARKQDLTEKEINLKSLILEKYAAFSDDLPELILSSEDE